MNILIATVHVPFVRGGGEILAEGLRDAAVAAGHRAEILAKPFHYSPNVRIRESIDWWSVQDLRSYCSIPVDRVIHLKFPCYYASNGDAVLWLLHQHRPFYELWKSLPNPVENKANDSLELRDYVVKSDTRMLRKLPRRFTISRRVSERMVQFNGVESSPLYHPPFAAERFYCNESLPYVFFPSRLEGHKRQRLLIEAMAHVRSTIIAVIAGEGGQRGELERLVGELNLTGKVRLVGQIDHNMMCAFYANCRVVFFGPYDEDYGYVTLEAMLSSKPVISCSDSGGPLEFVLPGTTGTVTEPTPQSVAVAIDRYALDAAFALDQGRQAKLHYEELGLGWDSVIETLVA